MQEHNNLKISAGYFGKLPQYSDFIKHNAGGPEILLIDNWIQQGIKSIKLKMKDSWKSIYKNAPVYNFLFPFTNTANLIAGIIKPEFDKNEREYPFITFLTFPFSLLQNSEYHRLPVILSGQFNDMDKLNYSNLFEMNDEIVSLKIDSSADGNDEINKYLNTSQKEFWTSILTDQSTPVELMFNLLTLNENISAVKLTLNSTKELLPYNLSVIILLITTIVKYNNKPAVFWSTKDNISTIFLFFERSELQYCDLLDPDSTNAFNLNCPGKLLNEQTTLNELITEIKNLRVT